MSVRRFPASSEQPSVNSDRRRLQNRISSQKARHKRKEHLLAMEECIKSLKEEVDSLKLENIQLKKQLNENNHRESTYSHSTEDELFSLSSNNTADNFHSSIPSDCFSTFEEGDIKQFVRPEVSQKTCKLLSILFLASIMIFLTTLCQSETKVLCQMMSMNSYSFSTKIWPQLLIIMKTVSNQNLVKLKPKR
ncbi:MAG: hypothetical protein MHPSP_002693 [Paramarteilia canceri]